MKAAFHKISIDFEYLNEIYTINSDPYNTLSELKEIVSKKIFPCPGNVHCFYKNADLFEKEDEEIAKLFPHNSKIKIKLKKPGSVKRRSVLIDPNSPYLEPLESKPKYPKIEAFVSPTKKGKTIRSNKILRLMSIPSMTNTLTDSRPSSKMNFKNIEETIHDNIKNNDLFYFLHKNEIDKMKSSKKVNKNTNEDDVNSIISRYKSSKNQNILSEKKEIKEINFLLSNLKGKNLNKQQLQNIINPYHSKRNTLNNKNLPLKTINSKPILKQLKLNISTDSKEERNDTDNNEASNIDKESIKNDNNNQINKDNMNNNNSNVNNNQINKNIIDENYQCSSCKTEIITSYCLNCNEFKCNTCIDLCKIDEHEFISINLEEDCIKNVHTYGELVTSNIDKKLEEILELNREMNIFDIKKYRDNLITFINEILNLYNEINNILENAYKEKVIKKEMNKFELGSNKIKAEINEILQKANQYLKSEVNISKPKYKMMNMQYFFNLINEKGKLYNSIKDNMKKYYLNSAINKNMEKCFKEMEKLMNTLINKENPFLLNNDLKKEYEILIQNNNNLKKDKRKYYVKRKTLPTNKINIPNFPSIGPDKNLNPDVNNSTLLNL